MDKTLWLKRVNVVLFLLLLYQGTTGLLSDLMNQKVFAVIHPVGGALLVVMALIHIGLNWVWVTSVYMQKRMGTGE